VTAGRKKPPGASAAAGREGRPARLPDGFGPAGRITLQQIQEKEENPMAVNLAKGQRVSLDKGMTMALVGLGWDTNTYDGGYDFDLDASAFMLGADGKVRKDEDFIFYGNLKSQDGSVRHTGDNLTGEGDGDDEVLIIDFAKVPADIQKIAITVTIYDAQVRRQNFGQVSNAYVRVARMAGPEDMVGSEVLKFDLMEEFSIETALVVCEIYRHNGDWKFNAVGAGYQGGLEALCRSYGVNV
jgi:tellurium resistance protein TerD